MHNFPREEEINHYSGCRSPTHLNIFVVSKVMVILVRGGALPHRDLSGT